MGAEAAAFSAHEQLDNLIILYDSNDVTLDKMAEFTMSEDTAARYTAYGWDVQTIDGHDLSAVSQVRFLFALVRRRNRAYGLGETAASGQQHWLVAFGLRTM